MRAKDMEDTIEALECRAQHVFEKYGDDRVAWLWLFHAAELQWELDKLTGDKLTGGQHVQD